MWVNLEAGPLVLTLLSALIAGFVWYGQQSFLNKRQKELEELKASLQQANASELERQKHELALTHVKFQALHGKSFEAVGQAFATLFKYFRAVAAYVSPMDFDGRRKEEKLPEVAEAQREYSRFIFDNYLYIPKKHLTQLGDLAKTLADISNSFTVGQMQDRGPNTAFEGRTFGEHWEKCYNTFQQEAQPRFEAIHLAFQEFLGLPFGTEGSPSNAGPPDPGRHSRE